MVPLRDELSEDNPEQVDVLILGSGSAGLMASVWLAIYNNYFRADIKYAIIETRDGPLEVGQADGVQCRTVEIFEALGLEQHLLAEGYWVNEVCFWDAFEGGNGKTGVLDQSNKRRPIHRTGRAADTAPGLSHQPHIILNQARINELLIQKIQQLDGKKITYGQTLRTIRSTDHNTHPLLATTTTSDGKSHAFRSRYALGSDGAHSTVRHALNIPMEGDSTNAVWGVMDCFVKTTFPDIRKKCTIRAESGTLLIIPREGDRMVRFYIEMAANTSAKAITLRDLQAEAQAIFYPYTMEFIGTKWWSAYAIGQRLARDVKDPSGRIFLAGDACHTHSPKAGQGMNCSMQDGDNFGWKVASVLTGQARPEILQSYVTERQKYAKSLIDFDRKFAKMFSSAAETRTTPEEFEEGFVQAGKFTAGMAAHYDGSILSDGTKTGDKSCKNVVVGMRLPSAQIVRFSDSKPVQIQSLCALNGKWRLLAFGGHVQQPEDLRTINQLVRNIYADDTSRAAELLETIIVMHGDRHAFEPEHFGAHFDAQHTGKPWGVEAFKNIFFDDESFNHGHGRAYEKLGIDTAQGCAILVRPDQYVSGIYRTDDWENIQTFFDTRVLCA